MSNKKTTPFHFERSLASLSELVTQMEQGNLPLEQSLAYFEQGIRLVRDCQQALQEAEHKVQILTQQGTETLEAFTTKNHDPSSL